MATVKDVLREKRTKKESHHLWEAERSEGKIHIKRTQAEKEEWDVDQKTASTHKEAKMDKQAAKEMADVYWGLFAATLVDDPSLTQEIPAGVVKRFNAAVINEYPTIKTWEELRKAYGEEVIRDIRHAVANGINVRLASKFLNVPLIMAQDIINVTKGVDSVHVKAMVDGIKAGKTAEVVKIYGEDAKKIAEIFEDVKKTGMPKLAVDEKMKKILKTFWGPYGDLLTQEVKKRVRADLAKKWFTKHAVDEKAAELLSSFLGEYGSQWTRYIAPIIRPKK